jgi:ribonuclease HII
MKSKRAYVIGIDEAGRGPLAGPVAVGAVLIAPHFDPILVADIKNKDSKKLNHQKRELWYRKMEEWKSAGLINFHVALVSERVIDTQGISYAIKKGMAECLKKIKAKDIDCQILLDGSLHAPKEYIFQKTIIKGDEKEYPISLASIAAKVIRDRKMEKLSAKYPEYGFEVHKGYGTSEHRKLIRKFGPSEVHRRSFLKAILAN